MNGWRGVLAGALGLIILEVIVTSSQATGRVSGFFGGLASAVSWFVSEDAPGIPQKGASTSSATTATPTTTLASTVLTPPATAAPTPAYSSVNTKP